MISSTSRTAMFDFQNFRRITRDFTDPRWTRAPAVPTRARMRRARSRSPMFFFPPKQTFRRVYVCTCFRGTVARCRNTRGVPFAAPANVDEVIAVWSGRSCDRLTLGRSNKSLASRRQRARGSVVARAWTQHVRCDPDRRCPRVPARVRRDTMMRARRTRP